MPLYYFFSVLRLADYFIYFLLFTYSWSVTKLPSKTKATWTPEQPDLRIFLKNNIHNFYYYYFSWNAEEILYIDMIYLYRRCCIDLDLLQTICYQQFIIIAQFRWEGTPRDLNSLFFTFISWDQPSFSTQFFQQPIFITRQTRSPAWMVAKLRRGTAQRSNCSQTELLGGCSV